MLCVTQMQISLIPNKRMQIPTETNGVFLRCKKSSRVILPSFWTEIINKQERSTVDFECYDDHAMCCFRRGPWTKAALGIHVLIYPNFLFPISLVQEMAFSRERVRVAKAMYQSTIFGVEVDLNLRVRIFVKGHKFWKSVRNSGLSYTVV